MRLLFWVLLGVLVVVAVRRLGQSGARGAAPSAGGAPPPEDMVRCIRCGLNLPRSDAIPVDREWACCIEHARAPARAAPS